MSLILKLATLFILGVAELWAAAPAGVALHLHPLLVSLVAAAGAVGGGGAVILFGGPVRRWLQKKRRLDRVEKKEGLLNRIWDRYGVIGWGILAPLLVGSPLGAAFGLALGGKARRLFLWLSVGSVLWSILFSVFCAMGWRLLGH